MCGSVGWRSKPKRSIAWRNLHDHAAMCISPKTHQIQSQMNIACFHDRRRRPTDSAWAHPQQGACPAVKPLHPPTIGRRREARAGPHGITRAPLSARLEYLSRDGITKDGGPGRMCDAERDGADHRAFAE